jgi:murein DD-endopeptidase MepM/ murein hydrolase activator NlpD
MIRRVRVTNQQPPVGRFLQDLSIHIGWAGPDEDQMTVLQSKFARIAVGLVAACGLLYGLRGDLEPRSVAFAGLVPAMAHPRGAVFGPAQADGLVTARDLTAIPGEVELVTTTLGRGGTLAGALERLGLPAHERHRVARALARELNPARLPATTGLRAALDGQGLVRSVAIRTEPERFVRWSATADGGSVEIIELPVQTKIEGGGGRVVNSVRQALAGLPWADELTLAFADVVQWDVDLLLDPRVGDRVQIVYEALVLGEVPDDLPPFGPAASSPGDRIRPGRVLAAAYDGRMAHATAYWVDGPNGGGSYYDGEGAPMRKTFLKSPLNYRRISSRFSRARRHPVTRKVVPHHGVDFVAAPGTPVVAAADGRVVSAAWQGALGRAVRIRHGAEYVTVYGHLRSFADSVRVGTDVQQNQIIGYVGSTGRATGPHLHYTLIHRGRPIDPMSFRNPPAEPLPPELVSRLERVKLAWAPLLGAEPLLAGTGLARDSLRRGI